jgi:putative transposase
MALPTGYRRIVGELKKLGIALCASTARNILVEAGMHPTPDKSRRNPAIPWSQFIKVNLDSMVATDFLTKDIYTPFGRYTAYVLIFIHLGSRKVPGATRKRQSKVCKIVSVPCN